VKRGEIFGLLGPNGAGKSTTFKMMCGLLVPSSGKALVLNMDLKTSSGQARQHLGYMAQKFSLYGNLTVAQNLRFSPASMACVDGRSRIRSRGWLTPLALRLLPTRRPTPCRWALNSAWRWPAR
jgi:ABC-type multidrug transport system ATPase subunit